MEFKNLLFALLAVILATVWTACTKTELVAPAAKSDMKALGRDIVLFDNVAPPVTVDGHQLSAVWTVGGAGGEDTIKVRSTGLRSVTQLEYNGTIIPLDSLAAFGTKADSTFTCPTTAAFRLGYSGGNTAWTVKVGY